MTVPTTAPSVEFQNAGKPVAQPHYPVDQTGAVLPGSSGGTQTTSVVSTSTTIVKSSAGRLCKVLVTAANGANAINIYDNASAASGTIIGVVAASASVGTVIDLQMPAANGW